VIARSCLRAGLAGLLVLGCAHAKQIEAPSQAKPEPAPKPVASSQAAAPPPPPGHPALSASPAGTFEPGAVRKIQDALRGAGYEAPQSGHLDEGTQRQIARYQKARSMPDTGFPDDATLKKLGLDPGKLHKASP
jgi:peptidoglycan hydrolase-like protein with peptidoglycan-binding domain